MVSLLRILRAPRYPSVLLGVFVLIWAFLAIDPSYRGSWSIENVLIFLTVPVLVWSYYKFRLSNLSYTLIALFLILHTIGAHYTYAEVPFGFWLQQLFGFSRNHYDRIVHFAFGLLLAYPVREIFLRVAQTKGFWGYWFPLELTAALSALYEIIEWWTVLVVAPEVGSAYLGTQGDVWDAQKDMAVATLGALIAMVITALINWRYNPAFMREILKSLSLKRKKPLGEVRFAEMQKEK
jgi:putative membrane protein